MRPRPSAFRFPPQVPENYPVSSEVLAVLCMGVFFLLMPTGWFFQTGEILSQYVYAPYVSGGFFLPDVGALFAFFALLLNRRHAREDRALSLLVTIPLALLPALAALTASTAISPPLAWLTCIRWAEALLVFYVVWKSGFSQRIIALFLLISLCLQAVLAIAQAVKQAPLGLPGEMLAAPTQIGAAMVYAGGRSWLRAAGLSFHPNVLGGFFAVGLVLSLPLVKRWPARLGWWLMSAGLLLTFSRSAWLACAVTLLPSAAWLALRLPEMRRPLMISFGVLAAAALPFIMFFGGEIAGRFNLLGSLSETVSIGARGELIAVAITLIRQSPLSGVGAGNFPLAMLPYPTMDPPHYVHNVPLLLASEIGIPGGLAWLWLWLFPVIKGTAPQERLDAWPLVCSSALLALGLIALFDSYPWALTSGRYLFAVLLALCASGFARKRKAQSV